MRYLLLDLQNLLRSVGFPENTIVRMSAIGIYESGGNPSIINSGIWYKGRFSNEYSVGLFQINTKVHKRYSVEQLTNPITNATEALRIYRLQGYNAWFNSNKKFNRDYQGIASQAYNIYNNIQAPLNIQTVSQNYLDQNEQDFIEQEDNSILYILLALGAVILLS